MGISRQQALDCFASDDLIGIGMEADAVRRALHPEGVVTYSIERTLACDAADFFAELRRAEETGCTGVILTGGAVDTSLRTAKRSFPDLSVGIIAPDPEVLPHLVAAGLDFLLSPNLELHRAAHKLGLRTTAQLVFGAGESTEQLLDRLESIRDQQEETGGFAAFAPVAYHAPNGRELDEATAVEYLKTLAVCRMFLDTIENLQSDWTTQGLKVLQMGLRFGANDAGAVHPSNGPTEEEVRRVIRDAGFQPAQRDSAYRALMLN